MTGGGAYGAGKQYTDEAINNRLVSGVTNKGTWNASTNIPAISDATGQNGWFYKVSVSGTWNSIGFLVGDTVIHNGTKWERVPTGIESNGPIVVKYLKDTDVAFPTVRNSGSALLIGDYVAVDSHANLPFEIQGITFNNYFEIAEWTGTTWQKKSSSSGNTSILGVSNKLAESLSGNVDYQSEINAENKTAINAREKLENKLTSFDNFEEGDVTSYPNANAVKLLSDTKIPKTRQVAGKSLDADITVEQLINAFKDVARTYTNVSIDCDDNTIANIMVTMFKSGQVLSSIPDTVSTEEYKLATLKAVRDAITQAIQGAVKIKGEKNTVAEIEALTDMESGDEWFCKADSHFYLYTETGWIDAGGTVDLSNYIQKTDIVDNLTTNDSQKPLSAAQGKVLKDTVDEKQDKIEITDYADDIEDLNPHMTFTTKKLKTYLEMIVLNVEGNLTTPLTDIVGGYREIMKWPPLKTGYRYPSQMRVDITVPSGAHTCLGNKHEFYDSDGSQYVDPNIADDKKMSLNSIIKVENAYDSEGNEILIAEQVSNDNGDRVVEKDGTPFVRHETVEYTIDGTENPKVYTLKYQVGAGYEYVGSYKDENGNTVTGNFYRLVEVQIVPDKTYMYQCYLFNKMLDLVGFNHMVDSQGRLIEVNITESEVSKLIKAKQANVVSSYFRGISGTVEVIVKDYEASLNQVTMLFEEHEVEDPETGEMVVDYVSMKCHGSNAISGLVTQRTL